MTEADRLRQQADGRLRLASATTTASWGGLATIWNTRVFAEGAAYSSYGIDDADSFTAPAAQRLTTAKSLKYVQRPAN
jgi:hypothetical protein